MLAMVCTGKTGLSRPAHTECILSATIRIQRHAQTVIPILLLLLTAVISLPAQADSFVDLSIGLNADSNITRALLSSDRYSDTSLDVEVTAGRFYQLQPGRSVTTFATLAASRFDQLDGLDAQRLGLGASYQHKAGLGAYAPSVNLSLNWNQHNSVGKTRDRDTMELELSYSKRLSATWHATAGFLYEYSQGRHDGVRHSSMYSPVNDIYDFSQRGAFASAEYAFFNQALLSLSYSWVDGNTVSSALAPNPRLLGISSALTLDPAVPAPAGRRQVAYSLKTQAHLWSLDWSIPVGTDTAFSIAYALQQIAARAGVDYKNDRISVKLLHAW